MTLPNFDATFNGRWRTGKHIGAAKPLQIVKVRPVLLSRGYQVFTKLTTEREDFGTISGSKHNGAPWRPELRTDLGPWVVVPNVSSIEGEVQFDQNGVADPESVTVTLENIHFKAVTGVGGLYHQIMRGYFTPWRGQGRGNTPVGIPKNEWFDVFTSGYQVRIWTGYGDAIMPVFSGLIDECDVQSEQITLSCRTFGLVLHESRLFEQNKAAEIQAPIVFSNRLAADDRHREGYAAKASTAMPIHPAKNVLNKSNKVYWVSAGRNGRNFTEWIQIKVPKGRYETCIITPKRPGMECYLSIWARDGGLKGGSVKIDGEEIGNGWIDNGSGNVPGSQGGFPYVKKWKALDDKSQSLYFPFKLETGNDTTIRLSFRNLPYSPLFGKYRASLTKFYSNRRTVKKEAKNKNWILVDDASDLVKWALMWAGFREWEVEKVGIPFKEPVTFHQGQYLIDIIRYVCQQGGFGFNVRRPTWDDRSMGVPVFRRIRALSPAQYGITEVRDGDLLTSVGVKFSKEPLAYLLRTRGKPSPKGYREEEDRTKRVQAAYFPPWSGAWRGIVARDRNSASRPKGIGRLSGVQKHFVHTDEGLETVDECQMANLLTAEQMALAAYRGQIEIPGHPGFELDDQVSIKDEATFADTRMWIASRSWSFHQGEETEYKTTLNGAMIDTHDMLVLALDQQALLAQMVRLSEENLQ